MTEKINSKFERYFENANLPNANVTEEQGYFSREDKHLYYFLCAPKSPSNIGMVLCSPFGEEKVRTIRIFMSFARIMAALGITTMCFDYYGDGDSEGNFEDATYDDRIRDIHAAIDFLKIKKSIKKTGLLGLRWGGTLAALAAEDIKPDFLVLWDPIVDTAKYFFNALRLNIASQTLIWGKVKKNREALIKDMEAGENVIIEGYPLTGNLYNNAIKNDLKKQNFKFSGKALIIQISKSSGEIKQEIADLGRAYSYSEIHAVDKEFEWDKSIIWEPSPPQLFDTTITFLEKNGFV